LPTLNTRAGLAASESTIVESSPVRSFNSTNSALRDWILASDGRDSIALIDLDDPSRASIFKTRWILATSLPYLQVPSLSLHLFFFFLFSSYHFLLFFRFRLLSQIQPYWLSVFSAGVIVPRQAEFSLRKLTGSCSPRLPTSSADLSGGFVDYGTSTNPNALNNGYVSDLIRAVSFLALSSSPFCHFIIQLFCRFFSPSFFSL
jgi:hypothetical protein